MNTKSTKHQKQPNAQIPPSKWRNEITKNPRRMRPCHHPDRRKRIHAIVPPNMVSSDHQHGNTTQGVDGVESGLLCQLRINNYDSAPILLNTRVPQFQQKKRAEALIAPLSFSSNQYVNS